MSEVQWFLLDLFFLGYVEDPSSGLSFKMPSELNWACYFEVRTSQLHVPSNSHPVFISHTSCNYLVLLPILVFVFYSMLVAVAMPD